MTTAIVIGNGESRLGLPLSNFKNFKIGCNGICRDHLVDNLVCVDKRMVKEALDLSYKNPIYTRKDWLHHFNNIKNVCSVPTLPFNQNSRADNPFNWGSGPYAIFLAARDFNKILLIGFDLYSKSKFVNNIYKNTKNYDQAEKHAVDPRYWIYQITNIFSFFTNKTFIVYQEPEWKIPASWQLPNVLVDNLENIKYNINF